MTDSINNGGPAFPQMDPNSLHFNATGMTLRDWFAGQALAGAMSTLGDVHSIRWAEVTRDCYIAADNMLEARK